MRKCLLGLISQLSSEQLPRISCSCFWEFVHFFSRMEVIVSACRRFTSTTINAVSYWKSNRPFLNCSLTSKDNMFRFQSSKYLNNGSAMEIHPLFKTPLTGVQGLVQARVHREVIAASWLIEGSCDGQQNKRKVPSAIEVETSSLPLWRRMTVVTAAHAGSW